MRQFPTLGGKPSSFQSEPAKPVNMNNNCWAVLENEEVDITEEDDGTFIAANTWEGVKPGFFFGTKDKKLGYHADPQYDPSLAPVATEGPAVSEPATAAAITDNTTASAQTNQ